MRRRTAREPWGNREDDRVRVLLECEPHASPSIIASVIERHGFDVRTCEGPATGPCDLLEGGDCSLVDGADVVVNMLRAPGAGQDVLHEVTAVRGPSSVVAEMTHAQVREAAVGYPGATTPGLGGVRVVRTPVNTRALIDAINEAAQQGGTAAASPGAG